MKNTIKDFQLGNYNFHVYSIETEGGAVRGIEITDAFAGTEKIGFNEKLSITFTDANLIENESFKHENIKNINNLKDMCKFILKEIEQEDEE